MKLSMHSIFKAILGLFLTLFATNSLTQTATTGALVGRVKDVHGRGVANVTLTITGVNLIRPKAATSDNDGNFRISYIPPGKCTLSASMAGGFVTSEVRSVEINLSRTYSVTLLVRPKGNSTSERDRESLKLSRVQMSANSLDKSKAPTITVKDSHVPAERPPASDSRENEVEAKEYFKVGVGYGRSRLFKEAAISFTQAIRLKSNYSDAYYGLGQAYFDLGSWSEAIEALEQAIKINPKNSSARAKLGETYARLRVESKSSSEDKTPSGSRVALSALLASGPSGAVPRPATNAAELMQLYRVGVGDVLDIRLSKTPTDQSTLFTVTSHGLLQHPILARPVKVTELTPDEIRRRIEAELKNRAINEDPAVLVAVREYVSHTILVSGLVKDPGTKILRREAIPLYVVLADAHPLLEAGRATIVAKETGEVTTVELLDEKALNVVVRPGDVINVQATPKQFFYIGGEVKAPGEKTFRPGLTLTQAILAAGGLSRKSKEVRLARESASRLLVVTRHKLEDINSGKLPDPLIQQGDRITVVH